jgi:hypothetical protein
MAMDFQGSASFDQLAKQYFGGSYSHAPPSSPPDFGPISGHTYAAAGLAATTSSYPFFGLKSFGTGGSSMVGSYLHLSLSRLALRQPMYLHIQRLCLSLGHTLALIGVINPLWLEMGMAMEMDSDGQSGFFSRPFLVIDDKGGEEQGLKLEEGEEKEKISEFLLSVLDRPV